VYFPTTSNLSTPLFLFTSPNPDPFLFLSLSLSARLQPKNHLHNPTITTPSLSSPLPTVSSTIPSFPLSSSLSRSPNLSAESHGANSLASNFHRVPKVTCSPSGLESRKRWCGARQKTNKYLNNYPINVSVRKRVSEGRGARYTKQVLYRSLVQGGLVSYLQWSFLFKCFLV
jgi:hypothetical protein